MSEKLEPDMMDLLFVSSVGSHGCAVYWQEDQLLCLDSSPPHCVVNPIFWDWREPYASNADIWRKILQPESDLLEPEPNPLLKTFRELARKELLKFSPSNEDWQQFWDALDNTKVWSWESRYQFPDGGYHDGYWWVVEIKRGEQQLKSEGFIAYPTSFPVFCKAVSQLIGGRRFCGML